MVTRAPLSLSKILFRNCAIETSRHNVIHLTPRAMSIGVGYVFRLFCWLPRNFKRIKSEHVPYHAAMLDPRCYNASAEPASFTGKQIRDIISELYMAFKFVWWPFWVTTSDFRERERENPIYHEKLLQKMCTFKINKMNKIKILISKRSKITAPFYNTIFHSFLNILVSLIVTRVCFI